MPIGALMREWSLRPTSGLADHHSGSRSLSKLTCSPMGIVILKHDKIVIGGVSLHRGGLKLKNFLASKGPGLAGAR
jgi:hypothetical protein